MVGVIERSFGSPKHPALDVRRELFWYHQLEKVGGAGQAWKPSSRNSGRRGFSELRRG